MYVVLANELRLRVCSPCHNRGVFSDSSTMTSSSTVAESPKTSSIAGPTATPRVSGTYILTQSSVSAQKTAYIKLIWLV